MNAYSVPILEEGDQKKLIEKMKQVGFRDGGSFAEATTGTIICIILWPIIKTYLVYRYFDFEEDMSKVVDRAYEGTKKISQKTAFKMLKKMEA